MLEIDVNEADGCLLEDTDRRLVGLRPPVETIADQTPMHGATGELFIKTAAHHLGDVIERQLQPCPQFTDKSLFHWRETACNRLWRVWSVGDRGASAPAANRSLADSKIARQLSDRLPAALNVGPGFRGGGGIGVQVQVHDVRRSLIYELPRSTPIPSNQSPGTEHLRGHERIGYWSISHTGTRTASYINSQS